MTIRLPTDSALLKKNFTFGVATSSYQIEGAIHEGGRISSIWDTFCQKEGKVLNGESGEIACDHYHRWQADLELIESLGVDAYRFSIAWPRIIAEDGSVLEEGLIFYENIINTLNEKGIKPYVTLYHWDLPQHLEDRGGWLNRETAYHFADYADVVCQRFGDRVHTYTTLNEPWCSAYMGYRFGLHAPGLTGNRFGFQAMHHLLLAHGLALPKMRAAAPKASHGIVLNMQPYYPLTDSKADIEAAKFAEDEFNHFYAQPILMGSYPESFAKAWPEDLPLIVPGDLEIISGKIDYMGINYYSRGVVKHQPDSYYEGAPAEELFGGDVERTTMDWEVYPDGLTDLLVGLNDRYELPPIYITENGMASDDLIEDGRVNDEQRVRYFDSHLNALDQSIRKGVNVAGYFAWSLMDNFEWAEGYSKRFGMVFVDYETQARTLKNSAVSYRQLLSERS
ncbi:GH1 family beta-glucosidase [Endozoicomonas ascidiicola]|uniref:GH1 family beta-glucosidase n=1 Tax=Endozoicomonas ascidiicola TaxID=1698521 RepID=UPI00083449A6|nr:GH1 family beta-glucosidase [Endozoicomonas ascidiicola]